MGPRVTFPENRTCTTPPPSYFEAIETLDEEEDLEPEILALTCDREEEEDKGAWQDSGARSKKGGPWAGGMRLRRGKKEEATQKRGKNEERKKQEQKRKQQ